MKKIILAAAFLGLAFMASSTTARAATDISLTMESGDTVSFTSNGSGAAAVAAGSCSGGGNCLAGTASGNTPNGTALTSGTFGMAFSGTTISVTNSGTVSSPIYDLSQAGNIAFSMTTSAGTLTGNLQLVSLDTTGTFGSFNNNLNANLTITGGTLASQYSGAGEVSLLIVLPATPSVATLLTEASGANIQATALYGLLEPTPEPTSILLFGTGILAFAGLLRRRSGNA